MPLNRRRWITASLAALSACDGPGGAARSRLDTDWHRSDLQDNLLPHWLQHADAPDGAFLSGFNRQWQAAPRQAVYVTHQARLVYSFAIGHELTQDPRYLAAARRGTDFMLRRQRDPVHDGYFYSVSPDGAPAGTNKEAYGQAFALLALATIARVGREDRYREAALRLWQALSVGLFDRHGGVVKDHGRDFAPLSGLRTQNPQMHLFEALLVLDAATGDAAVRRGLRRVGDFVVYRLLQGLPEAEGGGARIPEWYDEDWRPVPTKEGGGRYDLGHQFEWAHLLTTASAAVPVYGQVAERVLAYALAAGYDENRGGCYQSAFPDAAKADTTKGFWQQAECLHALLVCARASGRNDLWRRYEQTLDLIKAELGDTQQGGWRAAESLPCRTGSCLDEQPDPYHMVSLHAAALTGPAA